MNWILENWVAIGTAALAVVGAASAIAALTPNKTDDAAVAFIRKIIDTLALNVWNAKNK
jgi:hypothetical protein